MMNVRPILCQYAIMKTGCPSVCLSNVATARTFDGHCSLVSQTNSYWIFSVSSFWPRQCTQDGTKSSEHGAIIPNRVRCWVKVPVKCSSYPVSGQIVGTIPNPVTLWEGMKKHWGYFLKIPHLNLAHTVMGESLGMRLDWDHLYLLSPAPSAHPFSLYHATRNGW